MAERLPSRASAADTAGVLFDVVLPTFGKGILIRRRGVVALADRLELDKRGVRRLQTLRARHGDRPLQLKLPGRPRVIILSAQDAADVLERTPSPFMAASDEKQSALAHFEPQVALASRGPVRAQRRDFNEVVLASDEETHPLADRFASVIEEELAPLVLPPGGTLDWALFSEGWFRVVRRIVLGDEARDDVALTRDLARLRKRANWAFLAPRKEALLKHFQQRVDAYIAKAPPHSLAARSAASARPGDAPADQLTHWLFAYDPAGMAVFRTLALLCAHPEAQERARDARHETGLHYLRACLLESLRLWATTPAILRQADQDTQLNGCVIQKDTGIVIFAPLFHRDDQMIDFADRFAPDIWKPGQTAAAEQALVPFSAGPARCPARHLVAMTGAMALAQLTGQYWRQTGGTRLDPDNLPATLDPYGLKFTPH